MGKAFPTWLHIKPDVCAALEEGKPIVALESTVITHGLPKPFNLDLALRMEAEINNAGVTPATIAVLDGQIRVGLNQKEIEKLALDSDTIKISRRDLGIAMAKGLSGGTTVAATMYIAHAAGIEVFATGGIGGVHRGESGDVSADLPELARTPVAIVCSGAKSILDLPRTIEWLETAGVPVLGWQSDEFPSFFTHSSGLPVNARVDTNAQAAEIVRAHWSLGLNSGILICVPCPESVVIDPEIAENALKKAEAKAYSRHISGKDLTPFLLSCLSEITGGDTMRANLVLLRHNARVAAELSRALQ
jgi:pseudouridine-5'-phosphate glycosidase